MLKPVRQILLIVMAVFMCIGFRTIPNGNSWDISRSSLTESKLFIQWELGSQAVPNDTPAADSLFGLGSITVDQVMASIFNDFNAVADSYVTLVSTADPDFATRGNDRTITIEFADSVGGADGSFVSNYSGSTIVACEIKILAEMLDSAKDLIWIINHEIAHCLGLEHPQETEDAIMSYFSDRDEPRLREDDKMGIIFLYPTNPSAARESPTLGLSCARR